MRSYRNVLPLRLLTRDSWMIVKENPDRKQQKKIQMIFLYLDCDDNLAGVLYKSEYLLDRKYWDKLLHNNSIVRSIAKTRIQGVNFWTMLPSS